LRSGCWRRSRSHVKKKNYNSLWFSRSESMAKKERKWGLLWTAFLGIITFETYFDMKKYPTWGFFSCNLKDVFGK
jgi:hypothetical protein